MKAAELLTHPAEQREPLVITQNGEAKAVLQDVASLEETQETLALLKIPALGNQAVAAGKVKPVADVVPAFAPGEPLSDGRRTCQTRGCNHPRCRAGLGVIHAHISGFDWVANANHVLDKLMDVVESLSKIPERVIYRITGSQVILHLIADGRRDMQSMLARRLNRANLRQCSLSSIASGSVVNSTPA